MIEMRRAQLSFGDGLIAEEVSDLREPWMKHADAVLADEDIVTAVYEALAKRHPKSRSRGRRGTPAEMVLRLLILKHVRNWSYAVLEREMRANLVYRDFTRVGGAKMPDAKTMGRWGIAVGPDVIKRIHERMVAIAQEKGVAAGRRMRVDTTVVETNIHYPTDSSLLGDGVRVLTRAMKKITEIAGEVGAKLRDRSRSVKLRVLDIARAARARGTEGQERLKRTYARLDEVGMRLENRIDLLGSGHLLAVENAATRLIDHTASQTAKVLDLLPRLRDSQVGKRGAAQSGERACSAGSAAPSGTTIHQGAEATARRIDEQRRGLSGVEDGGSTGQFCRFGDDASRPASRAIAAGHFRFS